MEKKITKGKLELYKDDFGNNIVTSDGFFIAEFKDEKTANFFLKAPEMFEMLEEVVKKLKGNGFPMLTGKIEQLLKEAT